MVIMKKAQSEVANETQLISQALNILEDIPNLTVKKIINKPKHSDREIDLIIELRNRQKKFNVAIEAKTSGEPAILRRSAAWLKNMLAQKKCDYAILVAPYVSNEGSLICRDMGIGFVDLSGNCLLNLEGLYVERIGFPNRFKKPREVQSLFSPKSSRVVRCLLSDPTKTWTLKRLSNETSVSIGLIHRIATALEDNLFAEKRPGGFQLEDPARLLEAWREEYQRRSRKWGRYVIRMGTIEDCIERLKAAALQNRVRYALSGPSGASLVSGYLNPSLIHVYVDILKSEFLEELNAYPIMSEGNFLIRVVGQENEFIGSREVKGIYIASNIQLYLDLWSMGGRGQEAAEELRRQRLRF